MASLPCLLLLACVPHAWRKPLWSVSTGFDSGNQFSLALNLSPAVEVRRAATSASSAGSVAAAADEGPSLSSPIATRFSADWLVLAVMVWSIGALLGLSSVLAGQVQLRRLARNAHPLHAPDWALLLSEACDTAAPAAASEAVAVRGQPDAADVGLVAAGGAAAGGGRAVADRAASGCAVARTRPREALGLPDADCRADCLRPLLDQSPGLACHPAHVRRTRAGLRRPGPEQRLHGIGLRHAPGGNRPNLPPRAAVGRHRDGALAPTEGPRRRHRGRLARAAVAAIHGAWPSWSSWAPWPCRSAGAAQSPPAARRRSSALRQEQIARLEAFARAKEKQSEELAAKAGESISPEFQRFFAAAIKGDWRTVTNRFEYYKQHHPQYDRGTNAPD